MVARRQWQSSMRQKHSRCWTHLVNAELGGALLAGAALVELGDEAEVAGHHHAGAAGNVVAEQALRLAVVPLRAQDRVQQPHLQRSKELSWAISSDAVFELRPNRVGCIAGQQAIMQAAEQRHSWTP